MRKSLLIITLVAVSTFVQDATAQQGLFTQTGFGGEVGYQTGDDFSVVGVDVGYAVNDLFEAGVGLSRESYDGFDWTYTNITPRVRVYPVRQSATMPVTLFVEGHYHFVSISGDESDNVSASGWGIGGGATHRLAAGESIDVLPFAKLTYTGYTEKYEFDGFEEEESSNTIFILVGGYVATETGPGTIYAAPFVEYHTEPGEDSTGTQVGVKVGIVLGS